nr:PREDICTED: uncharacterized protein LOC109038661 [Bemisia tabaci]XP_018909349.1 PREDICTED: uncharacterized protein LOC109038661 [Bemisia tabaci]
MPFSKDVEADYEERYHHANEENLLLKKTINQQLKLIKKLNASLQWYGRKDSKDDERSPSQDPGRECRLRELETSNKILSNKVKVLKQQLISLSSFQATPKPPTSRGVSPSKESVHSLPSKRPKSSTAPSDQRNQAESMMSTALEEKMNGQPLFTIDEDLEGLRGGSQLTVFDGDPGMRSDSAESVCDISSKLLVNVEVIRMKRMMKWQNAQLTTLLTCVDNLNQESQSMKETMNRLSEENNELKSSLSFEKKRYQMLQQNSTNKEQVKVLEEQIRDLQGERNTLRDHNKKLLSLAADHESHKTEHIRAVIKQTRDAECQMSCDSFPVKESTTIKFSAPSQRKNQRKHKYDALSHEEVSVSSKHSKQDISSDFSNALDLSSSSSAILDTDEGLSDHRLGEPMDTDQVESVSFGDASYSKIPKEKSSGTICNKNSTKRKKSKMEVDKNGQELQPNAADCIPSSAGNDNEKLASKTESKDLPNLGNGNEELLRAELAEKLCELERCRQMLKIQCNLNSIYKDEVEKLSSQLIKEREETHIDGSVSAVEVMLKEHLAKIEQFQVTKTLRSHEQQTDSQDFPDKSRAAENKKEVTVVVGVKDGNTSLIEEDEVVQKSNDAKIMENPTFNATATSVGISKQLESTNHVVSDSKSEENPSLIAQNDVCQFELYVHELVLSSHTLTPKTQLFLTWGFLDQEEYAYSPVKPVSDLNFSCSCIYKGHCSEEFLKYLISHGVVIEVYQVLGEGCFKIAEAMVDTSAAVKFPSKTHSSKIPLVSQIIVGALHSSIKLVCSCELRQQFLLQSQTKEELKGPGVEAGQ